MRPSSFVLAAFVLALGGCAPGRAGLRRFEYAQIIMGVEARITLHAEDADQARRAARAGFDRMVALDMVMSDYHRDSELMRLCRALPEAGRGGVPISDDLMRVLVESEHIARASHGAFDVTIGPLVQLWRAARRDGRRPEPAELEAAAARVGWARLVIDREHGTVWVHGTERIAIDLGGIGKGFALDEAVRAIEAAGVSRCLVDLGGDLAAGAPPPGRPAWRIARPGADGGSALVIPLVRMAVATSGDTEQHVEIDGIRYSHIVDPATGLGVTTRARVTVVAPSGAAADALASALSVLDPESGLLVLGRIPGASALIEVAGPDGLRRVRSPGFPALPAEPSPQSRPPPR